MSQANPITPDPDSALAELARDPVSRKRFMRMAGPGAAAALTVLLAACGGKEEEEEEEEKTTAGGGTASRGDLDILNYALTLEYLETDFYRKVNDAGLFSGKTADLLKRFGEHEAQHVDALRQTIRQLGGKPVRKPQFQFPMRDQASFLELAQALEEVGVGAYNGAAPSIKSKEVLAAAGGIVQIEARHAAAIRALRGQNPTPNGAFDKTLTKEETLKQAKPFIKG